MRSPLPPRLLGLVLVGALGACGGVQFALKPQVVEKAVVANSAPGGSCPTDGALFARTEFPVRAWLEAQGLGNTAACLERGADFSLEAGFLAAGGSTAPQDACTGKDIAGTLTLSWFEVTYDWVDAGVARTERYRLTCAEPTIDLGRSIDDISARVNACLAAMGADGDEFLRVALNRRPELLVVSAVGSCSADACYHLELNLRVRLLSATASTGPCP